MDLFIGTPGQGCGGGDPINTYYYLSHEGIVSGGDYGDKTGDTCLRARMPTLIFLIANRKCRIYPLFIASFIASHNSVMRHDSLPRATDTVDGRHGADAALRWPEQDL